MLTHYEVCVYIYVCVYIHIYIHPKLFVSVLYFETESQFAALASLELNYVDQAGLELSEILLPLSLWSAGTENTSHHAQLSLRFDRLLQAICYMIIPLLKKIFFLDLKRKAFFHFVLFIARRHTTQCYSCGHFGVDFCHWLADELMTGKVLKGFTILQNVFPQNPCEMAVSVFYSVKLVMLTLNPTSLGTCARFPRSFLVTLQFFLWSKRRENLTDSNSLNGVIYSFKACQDKLNKHLSENAARSLLCNCRYFV